MFGFGVFGGLGFKEDKHRVQNVRLLSVEGGPGLGVGSGPWD